MKHVMEHFGVGDAEMFGISPDYIIGYETGKGSNFFTLTILYNKQGERYERRIVCTEALAKEVVEWIKKLDNKTE